MLAQLCNIVTQLRAAIPEAGAGASHLSEDLVRAKLPALNRLNLAWRALDDLLLVHGSC
jgi:hypothetical protein